MFKGNIEIIPGKNPHDMNTKTENEIMKGAEKEENGKKRASTSGEEDFDMKQIKIKTRGKAVTAE